MDFDFSDDQQSLRDAVSRWVDKGYGFERRRAIVEAGGCDRAAWNEIADVKAYCAECGERLRMIAWGVESIL